MNTTYKRAAIAATTAVGVALGAPTLASAAVTIGGDIGVPGNPTQPCALACELAQISLAGGQTTAPFDGVVVRWRVNGATGLLGLRVLRSVASTPNFTFISTSATARPATTGVESFTTRQPIRAGDYVGLEWESFDARIGVAALGVSGDAVAEWLYVPDGQIATPLAFGPGGSIAYNADVEADADHDGYGDETQDECPTEASTRDVCPPPPPPALPPAPGTQSAPSTPAADRTPPVISGLARAVRLSKGGSISFLVACSEDATGVATATVRVARLVHFAARAITLTAHARTKVTLRLSHTNAALVRRALAKRAKPNAIVALSVKDSAGNPSATKLSLKLRH